MSNDPDAQKKEADQPEEPLEDLTPEKDPMGGGDPALDAQKKEIGEA